MLDSLCMRPILETTNATMSQATMLVTSDFSEEDVAKATFHSPRASEILPAAAKGDSVVIVGDDYTSSSDPEWMRVKRIFDDETTYDNDDVMLPPCNPCTVYALTRFLLAVLLSI